MLSAMQWQPWPQLLNNCTTYTTIPGKMLKFITFIRSNNLYRVMLHEIGSLPKGLALD